MGLKEEFTGFLEEYGVIGLAVAFIMGLAVKDLVGATVDDLIMPVVGVLLPGGNWQEAVFSIGAVSFQIGHFLSAFIDFLIIAFLIFAFVKYFLRKEKVEKV